MSTAGQRPEWVLDLLALGRLQGDGLVPLDAEDLVATARAMTGLDDFGPPTWRAGYDRLVVALQEEARLHALGRLLARSELLRNLENRLRVVEAHRRDPGLADRAISAPWFVTGTARSGTSILHELLAQDPAVRAPLAWEVLYSSPVAGRAETREDRAALVEREVRMWDRIAPEYLTMHENGAELPLECIFLTSHEFASEHWSGVHDVPGYQRWLQRADLAPAYDWHRRHVQVLDAPPAGGWWVFKAPSHLSALPALFGAYPDAWVIQTHRDPLRTVPSTISLMATLRRMRSDEVDVERLAAVMSTGVAALFDWVRARRADGTLPESRFIDVRYTDLVADPVGTIRTVYERAGRDLTGEHAERIRAYVAAKPQGRHGAHRYSLSEVGLDADALRARYAGYCEQYGVEPEG